MPRNTSFYKSQSSNAAYHKGFSTDMKSILINFVHIATIMYSLILLCHVRPVSITNNRSVTSALAIDLGSSDEHFARSDRNKDEKLDPQEFQEKGNVCFEATATEFTKADLNGDGFVTRPEYDTFFQQKIVTCRRMKHDNVIERAKDFDQDGDKKLQIFEVKSMLQERYKMKVKPNFRQIFERFDTEKDGALDEMELESFEDSIPFDETDLSDQKQKRQRRLSY